MNWCQDIGTETILHRLKLPVNVGSISELDIDRKLSRANTARYVRLDRDHAESISKAILRGDPMPYLVVRKIGSKFVIAGGNHRDEAMVMIAQPGRMAYIVECDNATFTQLCRLLNTVVGLGADREVRTKQAADAVIAGVMSTKCASVEFGVSTTAINWQIRSEKAKTLLASRVGHSVKIQCKVADALAEIQADAVFNSAFTLYKQSKAPATEIAKAIKNSLCKPSEAEQIKALSGAMEELERQYNSPVKSSKRSCLLRSLATLERVLVDVTSILELDISTDEEKEVRKRCRQIANILNSL